MKATRSQLFYIATCGAALIAALYVRTVLPSRFLLDDEHIQKVIDDPTVSPHNTSFQLMANLYRSLGLGSHPELVGLIGIGVFIGAVTIAVGFQRVAMASLTEMAVIGIALFVGLAYLAQYSKELITLLLVVSVLVLGRLRGGDIPVIVLCLAYALTMRPYWAIVAVVYLVWRVVLTRVNSLFQLLPVALMVYLIAQSAFSLSMGVDLNGQRTWLNDERSDVAVATLITNPFPDGNFSSAVIGTFAVFLLLIVPVSLLTSGAVYHTAAGVLIVVLWSVFFYALASGSCRRYFDETGLSGDDGQGAKKFEKEDWLMRTRAGSLLLAMLVVQAMFEPDYGSYLKHLAPMLPLLLAVFLRRPLSTANKLLRKARSESDSTTKAANKLSRSEDAAAHGFGRKSNVQVSLRTVENEGS